jgi:hypothetical protein
MTCQIAWINPVRQYMQMIQILQYVQVGINNLEEALNSEMKNIHQWLLSNKLILNFEKTDYMIIETRQRLAKIQKNTSVSCGGKLLKQVYSKKTLGVLIDNNLCWNEQIDNISKKVSKGIGMLRQGRI